MLTIRGYLYLIAVAWFAGLLAMVLTGDLIAGPATLGITIVAGILATHTKHGKIILERMKNAR